MMKELCSCFVKAATGKDLKKRSEKINNVIKNKEANINGEQLYFLNWRIIVSQCCVSFCHIIM